MALATKAEGQGTCSIVLPWHTRALTYPPNEDGPMVPGVEPWPPSRRAYASCNHWRVVIMQELASTLAVTNSYFAQHRYARPELTIRTLRTPGFHMILDVFLAMSA